MTPLPHHYRVESNAEPSANVALSAEGLPGLEAAAPAEFDGPGDQWSPESLLLASVASCFQLSFRAIAGASRLPWTSLRCGVRGTLDKTDEGPRFVRVDVHASLVVPADVDEAKGVRLLQKAEKACLVTNSLRADVHLETDVTKG